MRLQEAAGDGDATMMITQALAIQNALLLQQLSVQNALLAQRGFTSPDTETARGETQRVPEPFKLSGNAQPFVPSVKAPELETGECNPTVLMRNLPKTISRDQLLSIMDANGFFAAYDFLYIPFDFATQKAIGHAIINFVSIEEAMRFKESFDGFCQWPVPHAKAAAVVYVRDDEHKGQQVNVDRYRNSPVMHPIVPDVFKPVLLENGVRVAFPASDVKVKPPTRVPRGVWREWCHLRNGKGVRSQSPHVALEDAVTEQIVADIRPPPGLALIQPLEVLPLALSPPGLDLPPGLSPVVRPPPPQEEPPVAPVYLNSASEDCICFGGLDSIDEDAETLVLGQEVSRPAPLPAPWKPQNPANFARPALPSAWAPVAHKTPSAETEQLARNALLQMRMEELEKKVRQLSTTKKVEDLPIVSTEPSMLTVIQN